ncbi:hypothetical protein KIN20_011250 [Parelaphostrongylus tenuis]|uniref:Uncharacterized protein n=1 Tax=Parelaphostrongylus tenuis TaxID=148309 RepID=A0AAD5QJH8_PARTN|nr:hypothetical protein KIN20_011250 [Parelaphostrongylus tenuis]
MPFRAWFEKKIGLKHAEANRWLVLRIAKTMSCHPSNSSNTLSDYSISEDDVYVYCSIGGDPVGAVTCRTSNCPYSAIESRKKHDRDSGFSEYERTVDGFYTAIDDLPVFKDNVQSQKNYPEEDHIYYNLLYLEIEREAHSGNSNFVQNVQSLKKSNGPQPKTKMYTKRTASKSRKMDSRQSDISVKAVIIAGTVIHLSHLFQTNLIIGHH